MLKLYGFPMSNYFNMVKIALLEKDIPFEEITTMPNQEPDYLRKSPMGKVPCLDTGAGCITETLAIFEFLQTKYIDANSNLFPSDPLAAARVRELCRIVELYIELPARRHYPHVFFGEPRDESAVAEVKPTLERGVAAVKALAELAPYMSGETFSAADIVAYETFGYAAAVAQAIYAWDLIAAVPGLQASREQLAGRDSIKRTDLAQNEAMAAFQAQQASAG